ncbi:GNAT family N-acetyltransferase [Kaarinaea lacus]
MKIREAETKDAAAISHLATVLSEKYITPEFTETVAESFLVSLTPSSIKTNMNNGFRYHVAESDDRIIGIIGIKQGSHLYHLFVDEAYQKQGIARQLWYVARDACIAAGNNKEFTVNSSRYALGFYEKLGFVAQSAPQERNGVVAIPMKLTLNESKIVR